MKLSEYRVFICLFIFWSISGCAVIRLPKEDAAIIELNAKTKISLSFTDKKGKRLKPDYSQNRITEEIKKRYPGIEIENEFDDLRSGQNYSVFITKGVEGTLSGNAGQAAIFFVLFPIPIKENVDVAWKVRGPEGERLFSRKYSYTEFMFFPLFPIGIYQKIRRLKDERYIAENVSIFGELIGSLGLRKIAVSNGK